MNPFHSVDGSLRHAHMAADRHPDLPLPEATVRTRSGGLSGLGRGRGRLSTCALMPQATVIASLSASSIPAARKETTNGHPGHTAWLPLHDPAGGVTSPRSTATRPPRFSGRTLLRSGMNKAGGRVSPAPCASIRKHRGALCPFGHQTRQDTKSIRTRRIPMIPMAPTARTTRMPTLPRDQVKP